ncbi:unnamed protein product, partial [Pylaiella littoralis]
MLDARPALELLERHMSMPSTDFLFDERLLAAILPDVDRFCARDPDFLPFALNAVDALALQQEEWYALFPYVEVELETEPLFDGMTSFAALAPSKKPYFVGKRPTSEDINVFH